MIGVDSTRVKSRFAAMRQEQGLEPIELDDVTSILLEALVVEINHELANLHQVASLVDANCKNRVAKLERIVEGSQVR